MKTGRNDPCPCGSGKKYKRCCEGKSSRQELLYSKSLLALLGVLFVALAVGGIVAVFYSPDPSGAGTRVWSAEHGHWHDEGGGRAGSGGQRVRRPAGPAPPGQVWSPQHGHWHDAQ